MNNENKKILLHACCAPCSIMCVSSLRNENIELDLFWFNPNIKPEDEYNKRLKCLVNFAEKENLKIIRANSNNSCNSWLNSCESCYRSRLEETAKYASQNGYKAFTTTLLISPYQDHEAIKRIGEEAAEKFGVTFLYRDFRPFFRDGQKEARSRGYYMQKYCGCNSGNKEQVTGSRCIEDKFDRLELLTGSEGLEKLKNTKVIIFGVGGVGSWCTEALVRSGIGKISIVDFDTVCKSNINRQLQATTKTIGMNKVDVLKERLLEINPDCEITAHSKIFSKETASNFNIENYDFVIDAIDMIQNKIDLIETVCGKDNNYNSKLFSSMGMALKLDPSRIKTASIWKTDVCPLARLVRQGLRKRGFTGDFMTVYSDESSNYTNYTNYTNNGKKINGSIVTVTASAGLLLASLVVQDIIKNNKNIGI